jgi:hypothetical protein
MEQDDFKQKIDELFRLFKKLLEKYPSGEMEGINRFQFEQLKLFLQNYETVKDQLALEMMGSMNEPLRQMLNMFLKQLKEELGEDEPYFSPKEQITPVQHFDNITRIDQRLKEPGLSAEEIDRLLDERSRLMEGK